MNKPVTDLECAHLDLLDETLAELRQQVARLNNWGKTLAESLYLGSRLLAAGNGGSAAEAQHLTAELVGKFDTERRPFAAVALHADTSSLTAIGNDYGWEQVFARQVTAHALPGDVVMLLSTSGESHNLIHAAHASKAAGATVWALTGNFPNELAYVADDAVCLPGTTANVQEAHLVAVHLVCHAFDVALVALEKEHS